MFWISFTMSLMIVSRNFYAEKKPTVWNWIEGCGNSVVCDVKMNLQLLQFVSGHLIQCLSNRFYARFMFDSKINLPLGGIPSNSSRNMSFNSVRIGYLSKSYTYFLLFNDIMA